MYRVITLVVFACIAASAHGASDADAQADQENLFKRIGKQIHHDAKTGAKQAKEGLKEGGKQIGRSAAEGGKKTGDAVEQSAKKTAKEAQQTFDK